jgi:type I restriction-modification system DNA methylase subunit
MTNALSQLDELWEANADYARSVGLSGSATRTLLYLFALRFLSTHEPQLQNFWREMRLDSVFRQPFTGEKLDELTRVIEKRFPQLTRVFTQQLLPGLRATESLLERWVRSLDALGGTIKVNSREFGTWFSQKCESVVLGGGDGFQLTTPRPVAELMLRLAAPCANESVHDPCLGIGTILAVAAARIETREQSPTLSGQEIQPDVADLARLRLFLLGAHDVRINIGDVLRHPQFTQPGGPMNAELGIWPADDLELETFDVVLCDPPYGQRFGDTRFAEIDPYRRFVYGRLGRASGDMAFAQHAIACLKPHGRSVTLIPHGPLLRGGADLDIRTNMIAADVIDAVIGLPSGVLPGQSLELALLLCGRNKKESGRADKILFINASHRREALATTGNWQSLTDEIVAILENRKEVPNLARIVSREEIENNAFSLQPRRYIDRESQTSRIDILAAFLEARRSEHEAIQHAERMTDLLTQLERTK